MNLAELRTFVETVRRGSLSEAGRALGITQPGVTRHIQRLERELRTLLLERRDGPVRPTPAGREFFAFAERVLAEHQDVLARIGALRDEVRGCLNLAASTITGEYLVPRLLAEFAHLYPGVEASVVVLDTQAVVERVLAHEFEIGFVGAAVTTRQLSRIKIGEDEITLGVYPEHPFARRESIELDELAGQPLVLREAGSGTLRTLRQQIEAQGKRLPPHRVVATLSSTHAVIAAIAAGLGIGFVSSLAIPHLPAADPTHGGIRRVRINGITLRRDLWAVYEDERMTTRLLRAFVEFLRERPLSGG